MLEKVSPFNCQYSESDLKLFYLFTCQKQYGWDYLRSKIPHSARISEYCPLKKQPCVWHPWHIESTSSWGGLKRTKWMLWNIQTQHFEMSCMCLLRKYKKWCLWLLFIADNSILISDLPFWGRTCVKQAAVHQNQNYLPKSYKKDPIHKRTDNYCSTNIMSSECNWWRVELFFQIKKSNFIFNMFRERYSSANILIVFLHLNCTVSFYVQTPWKLDDSFQ